MSYTHKGSHLGVLFRLPLAQREFCGGEWKEPKRIYCPVLLCWPILHASVHKLNCCVGLAGLARLPIYPKCRGNCRRSLFRWCLLLLATAAAAGDFCTNFCPMNDSRKLCVSRLLLVWFGLVGPWWVWVWISWINDYYRYCRHQMCVMCVWDGKKVLLFHIIRW